MDRTIPQALVDAAKCDPTRGFRFISEEGVPGFAKDGADVSEASFSFTALERASARYGAALQALGMQRGDRVALVVPANEDFVLCFLGAMRAGIVPVPVYPPSGIGKFDGYLDNTKHIIAKSGARALVAPSELKRLLGTVQEHSPSLEQMIAVEAIRESKESLREEKIALEDVAFLQFTSGSTSRPKGVTVTHGNLAANIRCVMEQGLRASGESDTGVSWLPLYHDMGLIGFVLAPLVAKISVSFLPPLLFLKRPVTWFQAITRHRGTISYAPNFAYALCVKRIREKDLGEVDLSSWRVAGCGAEPIRPETLEAFSELFAQVGFRREAWLPSYGMAESSLAISFGELGSGAKTLSLDGEKLWGEGIVVPTSESDAGTIRLVSCGRAFDGHSIAIFGEDDLSGTSAFPEGKVGEIRIRGASVMSGYWQDPEATAESFAGGYLRTGDLGFLFSGEIFICGRSKEVVIINGRNYYPQDMEWVAARVDGVRKGNVIAFGARDPSGVENDRERLIVAFETQEQASPERAAQVAQAIRRAMQEELGLTLDDVLPLEPGTLPKTSSGKLQRTKARAAYEAGELSLPLASSESGTMDLVKVTVRSQLSYLKLAVLGARRSSLPPPLPSSDGKP